MTILDQQAKSAAKVQKRFDICKSRCNKIHFLAFRIVYLSVKWHFLWIFVKIICTIQNFCLSLQPFLQNFVKRDFWRKTEGSRRRVIGITGLCPMQHVCCLYHEMPFTGIFVWHMWLLYNQKHGLHRLNGKISDCRHFETLSTFWKRFLSPFCHIDLTKWMFFDEYSGKICICSIFFVSLSQFCCFLEQYCRLTEI